MSSSQPATSTDTSIGGTPDLYVAEALSRGNEVVFFDIVMGGDEKLGVGSELGRIKLELFTKDVGLDYASLKIMKEKPNDQIN